MMLPRGRLDDQCREPFGKVAMMGEVFAQGDAYERFMGRWSRLVAPPFLDWLGVPDGQRWADVGCGTGALSALVLDRCRPSSILGVDPSRAQVDEASRRVADPRARFEKGVAEDLSSGSFDVVVSGLVLNFVPDPVAAVRSMVRAAPGGVVAAYVWDYAVGMQLLRTFWDVAGALDPSAASLHEGHRFTWTAAEEVAEVLSRGGVRDLVTTDVVVPVVFEDFDDYWLPFLGGQGPAPAYVAGLGADARERLRLALATELTPAPDGRIALTARAWAVKGTAPASDVIRPGGDDRHFG